MNRRTSALCCLLLTAALLCALPSLWEGLAGRSGPRMARRLRPEKARMLTVWLLSDETEGQKLLLAEIAAFEKANAGARVYLRRADAAELFAADAVLPDAVLFSPGTLTDPERALLPLAGMEETLSGDALLAGKSGGVQYAAPLWYAPSVLAVPGDFFPEAARLAPAPTSFFALGTPAPTDPGPGDALPEAADIPWQALLARGGLAKPAGVALLQLLSMCPSAMRPALIAALSEGEASGTAATPGPAPASGQARVMTLAEYRAALGRGEALAGFAMTPAATERVLLLGLCRGGDLAKAFLAHLLSPAAQAAAAGHGLLPAAGVPLTGDALTLRLAESYRRGLLFPNAFAHTAQELAALCRDAFRRNESPAETLLRLR